jgi:hypothetical protein
VNYLETAPPPRHRHNPGGLSKPQWPEGAIVTARFSECDLYRYELVETWDPLGKKVMFLLMNPSVAGIEHADPTLIRTGKYARRWGYGCQMIGNVHAYRVTDSKELLKVDDPIGPDNDAAIVWMASQCEEVVLGFGMPPGRPTQVITSTQRSNRIVRLLRNAGANLKYLALCKNDITPRHPLYLKGNLLPQPYLVEA